MADYWGSNPMDDYSKIKDLINVFTFRNGDETCKHFLIEKKPCRRTISTFDINEEEVLFTLPFPYVYFLVAITTVNTGCYFKNFSCFFSTEKINFNMEMYGSPFPNTDSSSGAVCLEIPFTQNFDSSESSLVNYLLNRFWCTCFTNYYPVRFQVESQSKSKLIEYYNQWQALSVKDMLSYRIHRIYRSLNCYFNGFNNCEIWGPMPILECEND